MRTFLLISILFFLGTTFPGINCQENGFHNFIYNAAQAFPSWIVENGLDPTPKIPDELNLEYSQGYVNITVGKLWNQAISGYSGGMYDSYYSISTNLLLRNFHVRIDLYDFNVTSDYEAEGTVLSTIPMTGAGKVTVSPHYLDKYVELNVEAFDVTPEGYIDISAGSVEAKFYFELDVTSFEGLSAGGHEAEVERALSYVYRREFQKVNLSLFPLADYFREYMEKLFAKTPVSEIIDTTRPPPINN